MDMVIKNGTITINGKSYSGSNVSINSGSLTIDGVVQDDTIGHTVNIVVNGDCLDINNTAGNVSVIGSTGNVKTVSGDVVCGHVLGSVQTVSGDVKSGKVSGNIKTVSGDIYENQ